MHHFLAVAAGCRVEKRNRRIQPARDTLLGRCRRIITTQSLRFFYTSAIDSNSILLRWAVRFESASENSRSRVMDSLYVLIGVLFFAIALLVVERVFPRVKQ